MNGAEYAASDATELTQPLGRAHVTAGEVREAALRAIERSPPTLKSSSTGRSRTLRRVTARSLAFAPSRTPCPPRPRRTSSHAAGVPPRNRYIAPAAVSVRLPLVVRRSDEGPKKCARVTPRVPCSCSTTSISPAPRVFPPKRGKGVSAIALGADDAAKPVRAPRSAHSETAGDSSRMPVRPRMQGWPTRLPTGQARCCSMPEGATRVPWLLSM
jgi:hypothetical protein